MAGWNVIPVRRQQGWLEKAAAGLPAVQRGGAPGAAGNSRGTNVVDFIKHRTECIGKLLNLPPGTLWPICRVWNDFNADGRRQGKWDPGAGRTADPGIWQDQATANAQIPPES